VPTNPERAESIGASPEAIRLASRAEGLEALRPGETPGRGLLVDWGGLALAGLARQPLVRALGPARSVLDATAGLGYDAFLVAASGRRVRAIEREERVHALLADAWRRAVADPRIADIAARIRVERADARAILPLPPDAEEEAIYLDPMFPPKRRASALPPKEMQVVRALAGDDPDASETLRLALASGRRVVLKRPRHAPAGPCDFALSGKLARFEVYLPRPSRGVVPAPGP